MSVTAHAAGVPLEGLLALVCGGGALWAFARAWTLQITGRARQTLRRGRSPSRSTG